MSRKYSTGPILLVCLLELLFLGGLWWQGNIQSQLIDKSVNDIADLKDPSPFRVALMGHLGKIQLGLQGYLRSVDASLLEQVAQSRKDFEASLPEFEKQNPPLFPKTAVDEIHRTFGMYQEAIDHALEANLRRLQSRATLEQNFARIISLITRQIRPLIRTQQAEAEERRESILNVENQARSWQQNLVKAWAAPSTAAAELTFENDNRGASYLDRYARMELLPAERRSQREVRSLWQANGDLARQSFAVEKIVNEAEDFMKSQRVQVVDALNKYLPVMPPAQLEARRHGYVQAMRLHLGLICAMVLVGLISLRFASVSLYRLGRGQPLFAPRKKAPKREDLHDVDDATLHMDLKGTITKWTAAAETLYGYRPAEIRGKVISELFESESEISRLYQGLLEAPQTVFETIHKKKNGEVFPVHIEFRPATDSSGRTVEIGLLCSRR